jgi:carbonic anhydrase/acetyltransferase-like protein (isoleucine patch superfamily)
MLPGSAIPFIERPELENITIREFEGTRPSVDPTAFIAAGCRIIGNVHVGPESSIWYNCVLRGDLNRIRIGARTNIQDGTAVHVDDPGSGHEGFPTIIGDDVLIGHMAMVHGCVLHDRSFVGLGSIVMDGCEIESEAMLAAGAMLTPGKRIPSGQLWAGRPAKFVRELTLSELRTMAEGVRKYVDLGKRHRTLLTGA